MSEIKVAANRLVKRYGDVAAVNDLSLEIRAGEIFGLLGPNGAGKTTAMEMMEGLRSPDAGTCHICGFDAQQQQDKVRNLVGIQFQQTALPEEVKVVELVELYRSFYANPVPTGDLLHQFGLAELAKRKADQLSGGQKQRLALALALVGRPEVLFLDEPTTGLDPQSRRKLWEAIRTMKAEGRAVIMTTHYMDEAEMLCDRLSIMDQGKILATGTPQALIDEYGPELAIEFAAPEDQIDAAELSRLSAVTGVKVTEGEVTLCTADNARTLMGLAAYAQQKGMALRGLRTRQATLEDVFLALTGRRLRD